MYAAQDSTIQLALVGCGGRGTGAAGNALSIDSGPIKLIAMADVFDKNLKASHENLKKTHESDGKLDVPEDATAALVGFMINANRIGKASFTSQYGRK